VQLQQLPASSVQAVRSIGLWAGVDLAPGIGARQVCERMMALGVLAKDTHETTVRLAPPLVITSEEVDRLVTVLGQAIEDVRTT
jgi:ornithine--oxo-acid transaminase